MARDKSLFDCSETHPGVQVMRRDSVSQGVGEADNLPFMLCPPGAGAVVLLVHGFTGTPWEMRPLAEYLADAGIASLAVRLPGHGTSPRDLARCRWEDWHAAVLKGYRAVEGNFPSIYGMGMSTGCLLLLHMASVHPLGGLVLFSPYLRPMHRLAPFAGWLRWIFRYHAKSDGHQQDKHYYSLRPVSGIHQINRLRHKVSRQLTRVSCPVLAFNGEGDDLVDIASGRRLVDSLGSGVRVHLRYGPDVPHVLTGEGNPCRQAMFLQATRFVQELAESATAGRQR